MTGLVVITRPEPDASDYAAELQADGFKVFVEPMLVIEPVAFQLPDLSRYDGFLLTSANALQDPAIKSQDDIVVYCVGKHTAEAAKDVGFLDVISVDGTGTDLLAYVLALPDVQSKHFLHLCGDHVAFPLVEKLREKGVHAESLEVYKSVQVTKFSSAFLEVLHSGKVEIITFFSKRTAEAFVSCVDQSESEAALAGIKALSISDSVLECVRHYSWKSMYVSETPDRAGMLKILKAISRGEKNMSKTSAIENAQDVIEAFGGIRPMAKKMDVAVTTVQGWKKRNAIPATRFDQVVQAAVDHDVDLSGLLDGAPVANQNEGSETKVAHEDKAVDAAQQVDEITHVVEAVLNESDKRARDDEDIVALKQQISDIEKQAVLKSTGASAAVVVILVLIAAAITAYFLWPRTDYAAQEAERLRVLEEELGAVKEKQSFLGTIVPEDLGAQIDALKTQAEQAQIAITEKVEQAEAVAQQVQERAVVIQQDVLAEDAGTFDERIEKLEVHANDIAQDLQGSPAIIGLLDRVQVLQTDLGGQAQLDQASVALQEILGVVGASGDGSVDAVNQALEAARAQSAVLGQTFDGVPQNELKAAALLLGMTQLRSSLNRGNDAFAGDLDILLNLIGQDNAELNAALMQLAPHAQSGVLSLSGLSSEFRTLAGDAVAASLQGEDVSFQERASARLNELMRIEQAGELVTGTPTQATLLKAENLLQAGDVQGAINAAQSLDGGAADVLAPWLEQAQARVVADQVEGLLGQAISTQAYGGAGGITASGLKPAGASGSRYIEDPETGLKVYVPGQ